MKHFYAILITSLLCRFGCLSAIAEEGAPRDHSEMSLSVQAEESIEVTSRDGSIFIRTPRQVEVTVYTILGQIVTTRTVNPGSTELKIGTRGIYLVKIEGKTQKVAI